LFFDLLHFATGGGRLLRLFIAQALGALPAAKMVEALRAWDNTLPAAVNPHAASILARDTPQRWPYWAPSEHTLFHPFHRKAS
jgi:hypothetical protein